MDVKTKGHKMRVTRHDDLRNFRDNGELSDIRITVGNSTFDLHKFPLYVHSEFFRGLCRSDMVDKNEVHLSELPGGAKTFSLIADYCYGKDIAIDHTNVTELRCAAEYLQMTSQGNLASETNTALVKIMATAQHSPSVLAHVVRCCCRMGEIACQTNILSSCFTTVLEIWKAGDLPKVLCETILYLPVQWFVGLVVAARDNKVPINSTAKLSSQYLSNLVEQQRDLINTFLERDRSAKHVLRNEECDLGNVIDQLLLELPEEARLDEIMDDNLIYLLYRLSLMLHCKCETVLLRAVCKTIHKIPQEILVKFTQSNITSITEYIINNGLHSPQILCNTVDKYLRARVEQKSIDVDEFRGLTRLLPKDHREHHDSLLVITEQFFATTELSDEEKLKTLDAIDPRQLHEETLKIASGNAVIPSRFIVNSALAVASQLRSDLTEVRSELEIQKQAMNDVNFAVTDVIKGQWTSNDVTINITPKNMDNTRVQFVKVMERNALKNLWLEHEEYEGKMTLCVRSRGAIAQEPESPPQKCETSTWFLFDPFNEELVEMKRSKYNSLIIGENYHKKHNTTSYWPFGGVS